MKSGQKFWDKEYKKNTHLALSNNPSEDLMKFTRFLLRQNGKTLLNPSSTALDLGCGNGRNLIYLAQEFGIQGLGFDISDEALRQAQALSKDLPLTYQKCSIAPPLPVPDESKTFVLDMMVSHVLDKKSHEDLIAEVARILKPDGWFFFKTFLRDGDRNVSKLLKEHPGEEAGSYIHPKIGITEHVFSEEELINLLSPHFIIEKILKSHGHLRRGKAAKRRSVSLYARKG